MPFHRSLFALLASALLIGAAAPPRLVYPPAPPGAVTDTYFGTQVADPYRWLEDASDPRTRAWAQAETDLARTYIHSDPAYASLRARVETLAHGSPSRSGLQIAGRHWIYLRRTPPAPQAALVVRDGENAPDRCR